MELALIGYFPRRTNIPEDSGYWLGDNVREVCSVNGCMNPRPDDWIDHWVHNELGFFNTRADARSITHDCASRHDLFAYRLLPVRFRHGKREVILPPEYPVEPLLEDFVSLGFDVVNRMEEGIPNDAVWPYCEATVPGMSSPVHIMATFGCSPLSCNGLSKEFPVNQYCLVETLAEAESLAVHCSREEPEPRPYYVIEVLREKW